MNHCLARICEWVGAKRVAMGLFASAPHSDYAAYWGATGLMLDGKDEKAAGLLARIHTAHPAWPRTRRLLATLYLRTNPEKAVELYTPAAGIWDFLIRGDLLYFFLHREEEGVSSWQGAYAMVDWTTARELENPARLLLKRLWRATREPALLERFADLDTDNFRQQDIVDYALLLAERGERDKAREMLDRGFYLYRGDAKLTGCWQELGFGDPPAYRRRSRPQAVRHNIYTGLLTEASDVAAVVDQAHREHPGGVVTIASSVLTMTEGTLLWIPTFRPSRLARFLGPFTGHGAGPIVHWYSYPREAAWKVQAYIELAGAGRVILGAVLAVLGKLVGRKGLFYDVVGPVAKAVDSDKVMPYDACLVPGPLDVQQSIRRLSKGGAQVSIVDVNDVFAPEIIGSTAGVDEDWIATALSDNPAGNDDSMTPIVVVMPR